MTNILQSDIDIDSIKNLSAIADKLQKGGLTIPGNLKVIGDLSVDKNFNYLPRGSIIAYNGNQAPSGWAICDGGTYENYTTPDLRSKFIIGSKNENNFRTGDSGGSEKISTQNLPNFETTTDNDGVHTHNMPFSCKDVTQCHSHNQQLFVDDRKGRFGPIAAHTQANKHDGTYSHIMGSMKGSSEHSHSVKFTGSNTDYYQPYYALTYIVKL